MCPELSSLTQHAPQRSGALSAQDERTLLMSGEKGGRTGRRYDAALYMPFNGFPMCPLLSSI